MRVLGSDGAAPTSTKWVDPNKGGVEVPDIRSRWVARDFKKKGERDREDLFALMPPLEAKKVLFKLASSRQTGKNTRRGKG